MGDAVAFDLQLITIVGTANPSAPWASVVGREEIVTTRIEVPTNGRVELVDDELRLYGPGDEFAAVAWSRVANQDEIRELFDL